MKIRFSKFLAILLMMTISMLVNVNHNGAVQNQCDIIAVAQASDIEHAASNITVPENIYIPIDYTNEANWAYYAIGENKAADLFLVCPTVAMGHDGKLNMSMTDTKTKQNFLGALNMERGIYEKVTRLYAPYYRQASFPVYSMSEENAKPYFKLAYKDVRNAFLHYMKTTPEERPLVLAGFSQGSDMVLRLLKEFFREERYQKRLVAAYCIGWRITEQDLKECPWLKPARRKNDLGTIISFNSESPETTNSLLVPAGVKTYSINPLNWKTNSSMAKAALNKGACFTDYNNVIKSEVPALTGAYIDKTRGTLKLPDINPKAYANTLFPDGVYHLYDYQFFYRNLQENVELRVNSWLKWKYEMRHQYR